MFTRTHYRIIQENIQIFDVSDTTNRGKHINQINLSVYETKRNEIETYLQNYYFCWKYTKDYDTILIQQYNEELLRWSIKNFDRYQTHINEHQHYIVLKNKKEPTKRVLLPLETRYSKNYQIKIKKRLSWLIHEYGNTNAVSLILTIDPKKYAYDKYLMWKNIKKEFNRFLTDLRYYFKKRRLLFPKYLCSIESQKGRPENNYIARGNPHIHMVFLDCIRLLDWRKIRDLWGLGHIYINRTYEGKKIRYPINYIAKYITKTFTDTNENNLLTQALCWLFSIRSFSTSRGLIYPLHKKGKGLWEIELLVIVKKPVPFDVSKIINDLIFSKQNPEPPTIVLLNNGGEA